MTSKKVPKIRVLAVENGLADFALLVELLRETGNDFEPVQSTRLSEAQQRLAKESFDVVLLDLALPDSMGLDTLQGLRTHLQSVPIVVLSDSSDMSLSVRAVEQGAQDFLAKGNLTSEVLDRTIRNAITRHRLVSQLKDSERQLNMLAEQLPAMLWTTNETLKLTSSRGRELRVLRLKPEQISGRQVDELFSSSRMAATVGEMHRRALLGRSTSADWEWKGRWYHGHVEPLTNSVNEIVGTIGVALDVTDEYKLKRDVQAAHQVQQHLLPSKPPTLRGFDIAGKCFPAEDCSGDFFDYIPMPNGRLSIVLADVSGHGFGPAILAAAIRSYLRMAAVLGNQAHEMLALGNRLLVSDGELTPFASVFVASLNPEERTFRYASAGHPAYLIRESGESVRLETMSVPIGVRNDELFTLSSRTRLRTGDILLLVSDGVFEARNGDGKYFGIDRALGIVHENRLESAATIVQRLHDAAVTFAGRTTQEDDLTIVLVRSVAASEEMRETWTV